MPRSIRILQLHLGHHHGRGHRRPLAYLDLRERDEETTLTTPVFVRNAIKIGRSHSPEILTGLGIAGVFTTAYLTAKATVQATKKATWSEHTSPGGESKDQRNERWKDNVRDNWKLYVPAATSGVVTVACVFSAQRVSLRRTAAAAAAYSVAERGFMEYKERVVEKIGATQEQKIRDGISQEKLNNSPSSKQVIHIGTGRVLCCELFTGRYFMSDMETLKKAQNDINAKVNSERWVYLDEFYELIGLPYTSHSSSVGWDSAKLMELQFTTALSDKEEPCLAFEYNYVKPL